MAEKKIIKANGEPVEAKAAETAADKPAPKKKTIKRTDGSTVTVKPAAPVAEEGSATKYRIGAIALWVLAIAFEVLAVLVLFGKIAITAIPTLALIIIFLVLDLACVSVGSTLWKKANRIDPASEANKVKFWLWNNMGLIVTAFAFVPFVILTLTNKNADKKTKAIATVVAIIALLVGGLVSYDWNPISAEQKAEAVETLGDQFVYWSPFGTVYHTDPDCSHLNHSDTLTEGKVDEAIEANKTRLCKTCAARDGIEISSTEKGEVTDLPAADDAETKAEEELPVVDANEADEELPVIENAE